jgi:hypothetical protein
MAPDLDGRLEAVVDGRAVGWVWDRKRPEETLEVEVLVDGEAVARGRGEVQRPALAEAGIGNGRYGFDVPLPERLSEEKEHTIEVLAGPTRDEVSPSSEFKTLVRDSSGAWQGITFLAGGNGDRPFVPPPDELPDPARAALLGRHGCLFPFDDGRLTPDRLLGEPLLTGDGATRCREAIVERRRRLKEIGVPYLFAVAPLKERVYRKLLPPGTELHPDRPVSQVDAAVRAVDGGEVFDLLPAVREASRAGWAFPRTGSEWSDLGAFFAYRELVREVGKRVISLPDALGPDEARLSPRADFRGDLADKPKVRFAEGSFEAADSAGSSEEIEAADLSRLRALRMPAPPHLEVTRERAPHLYEIGDEPALPSAVLLGDGCCLALLPWLAEHFRRFAFLWTDELPLEAIELEMPDVVIHVVSEHRLLHAP